MSVGGQCQRRDAAAHRDECRALAGLGKARLLVDASVLLAVRIGEQVCTICVFARRLG